MAGLTVAAATAAAKRKRKKENGRMQLTGRNSKNEERTGIE